MALSNTAQPINTSLRKIAVVVATAVAGMSAYAHAAETPKKIRNHYCYCRTGCAGECLGACTDDCSKAHCNGDENRYTDRENPAVHFRGHT